MLSTMTTNVAKAALEALAEAERQQLEHDARSALPEYPTADDLEGFTGTKASTWRYWAHIKKGPPSFKLGRRRVWKRSDVLRWIAEQQQASA